MGGYKINLKGVRKIYLIFFSALAIILLLTICILWYLSFKIPTNSGKSEVLLHDYSLKWSSSLNKKQSYNSCASYSSMAFLYVVSDTVFDPEFINSNITGKMKNNYTLPWGVTSFLKKQGIKAKINWFGLFDNNSRTRWIKRRIEKGVPVILIVGNKNYLHYITVLGYSESCFYIYDPGLALDKNGDLAGNISKPIGEVLDWWESAFFKIFHLNLAISK
jgi:hypothetical protein